MQDDEAIPLSGDGHDPPPMQSAPPADVRPGQAGTLLTGRATPRDVTATIVDLAMRGYLTIEEAPRTPEMRRDWRLVQLKKKGDLLDYERLLLDALFADAATDHGARSTQMSGLGSAFTGSLKEAEGALATDVTERGWFTSRPDVVRLKWIIVGGLVFVAGLAATIAAAAYADVRARRRLLRGRQRLLRRGRGRWRRRIMVTVRTVPPQVEATAMTRPPSLKPGQGMLAAPR